MLAGIPVWHTVFISTQIKSKDVWGTQHMLPDTGQDTCVHSHAGQFQRWPGQGDMQRELVAGSHPQDWVRNPHCCCAESMGQLTATP